MSGSKSEEKNDSMEIDEKPLGKKSFARDAPYLFRCHRCKQACHYVHRECLALLARKYRKLRSHDVCSEESS